jgi:hypothetical protein
MGHESYTRRELIQRSSDRSFGFVFAAVFFIIGLLPLLAGRSAYIWLLVIGAGFLLVALAAPTLLAPLNRLWGRFGLLLHRVVSPLVLGIMFFLVVTPTALLMRVFGKDPLRLKFDNAASSYWIDRIPPGPTPESLKEQF